MKPIYYWPGERVDLPCIMCKRGDAYNGKMKYWSVLRVGKFIKKFDRLSIFSKNWTLIDNSTARNMRAEFENVIYMPLFDPTSAGNRRNTSTENQRPNMRFIQRDGRLKILTVCF